MAQKRGDADLVTIIIIAIVILAAAAVVITVIVKANRNGMTFLDYISHAFRALSARGG